MEQLLDMSIIPVRYTLKDDLAQKIQELFAQGVQVFVGGGGTGRIVSRLGGSVFLDLPQRANIRNALNRAIILAENTRMEGPIAAISRRLCTTARRDDLHQHGIRSRVP